MLRILVALALLLPTLPTAAAEEPCPDPGAAVAPGTYGCRLVPSPADEYGVATLSFRLAVPDGMGARAWVERPEPGTIGASLSRTGHAVHGAVTHGERLELEISPVGSDVWLSVSGDGEARFGSAPIPLPRLVMGAVQVVDATSRGPGGQSVPVPFHKTVRVHVQNLGDADSRGAGIEGWTQGTHGFGRRPLLGGGSLVLAPGEARVVEMDWDQTAQAGGFALAIRLTSPLDAAMTDRLLTRRAPVHLDVYEGFALPLAQRAEAREDGAWAGIGPAGFPQGHAPWHAATVEARASGARACALGACA